MAFENKYGKSPLDASRNNALPPYLDLLLKEYGAGGSNIEFLQLELKERDWIFGQYGFEQTIKGGGNITDKSAIVVLSTEGKLYSITGAGTILYNVSIYNPGDNRYTFRTTCPGNENIIVTLLIITPTGSEVNVYENL